jgi:hypothetical protein
VDWSRLATPFCLELSFGVLVAMAFVPRAPVGRLFYRLMGTVALVPALVGLVPPLLSGELLWSDPLALAGALVLLAYPIYSGPVRGSRWGVALAAAILGAGAALVLSLARHDLLAEPGHLLLASLTAFATGTVAGSVGLAMVLGHWYLTVPNLAVSHLARLNRVTLLSMVLSLALVGLSCVVFRASLEQADPSLFEPRGLFALGTRIAVGLVMPLLFGLMTASSLRYENTRSATGILYASTVLVLIGTAASVSLQDSFGVPL